MEMVKQETLGFYNLIGERLDDLWEQYQHSTCEKQRHKINQDFKAELKAFDITFEQSRHDVSDPDFKQVKYQIGYLDRLHTTTMNRH